MCGERVFHCLGYKKGYQQILVKTIDTGFSFEIITYLVWFDMNFIDFGLHFLYRIYILYVYIIKYACSISAVTIISWQELPQCNIHLIISTIYGKTFACLFYLFFFLPITHYFDALNIAFSGFVL